MSHCGGCWNARGNGKRSARLGSRGMVIRRPSKLHANHTWPNSPVAYHCPRNQSPRRMENGDPSPPALQTIPSNQSYYRWPTVAGRSFRETLSPTRFFSLVTLAGVSVSRAGARVPPCGHNWGVQGTPWPSRVPLRRANQSRLDPNGI